MARISMEALYTGEGAGGKYGNGGIMGAVMTELFTHGVPEGYDAKTWAEMLLIKARAACGGTNETRGRFHIGHDRFGTVLFPYGGVIR